MDSQCPAQITLICDLEGALLAFWHVVCVKDLLDGGEGGGQEVSHTHCLPQQQLCRAGKCFVCSMLREFGVVSVLVCGPAGGVARCECQCGGGGADKIQARDCSNADWWAAGVRSLSRTGRADCRILCSALAARAAPPRHRLPSKLHAEHLYTSAQRLTGHVLSSE